MCTTVIITLTITWTLQLKIHLARVHGGLATSWQQKLLQPKRQRRQDKSMRARVEAAPAAAGPLILRSGRDGTQHLPYVVLHRARHGLRVCKMEPELVVGS